MKDPRKKKSKKITLLGWVQVGLAAAPVASGIINGIQGNTLWACASMVLAIIGLVAGRVVLKSYGKIQEARTASITVAGLLLLGLATGVCAVVFAPSARPTTAVFALILSWAFAAMIDSALFIRVKADPQGERMALSRFARLGGISAIGMAMIAGALGIAVEGVLRFEANKADSGAALIAIAVSLGAAAVTILVSRPAVVAMMLFSAAWVVAGFGAAIADDRLPVTGALTVAVGVAMVATSGVLWRWYWSSTRIGIVLLADAGLVTVTTISWSVSRLGTLVWLWAPTVLALGLAAYLFLSRTKLPQFRRMNSAPGWDTARYVVVIATTAPIGVAASIWAIALSAVGARGSALALLGIALGWLAVTVITFVAYLRRPHLTKDDFDKLNEATGPIPTVMS